MKISFIGAGSMASALGTLFSESGHTVRYGVRKPKEGQLSIPEVCQYGEIVCLAIPFHAIEDVLGKNKESLTGKIVVDLTNAINSDWSPLYLGEDSGGEKVARLLPRSKVVKAFNAIFADAIKPNALFFDVPNMTTFIASDDLVAAETVKAIADDSGFEGMVVGGIKNARHLEAMAHLNISIALGGGGTNAGFAYHQITNP